MSAPNKKPAPRGDIPHPDISIQVRLAPCTCVWEERSKGAKGFCAIASRLMENVALGEGSAHHLGLTIASHTSDRREGPPVSDRCLESRTKQRM